MSFIETLQFPFHQKNHPSNCNLVNDFFIKFYAYPRKDRFEAAQRIRNATFSIETSLKDNIKQLAANHKISFNDFIVRVLSQRVAEELGIDFYKIKTNIPKPRILTLDQKILKWIKNSLNSHESDVQ